MGEGRTATTTHQTSASKRVLGVDVGNSVTNLGLFADDTLLHSWSCTTREYLTADEARACIASFLAMASASQKVHDGIVASVVPTLTSAWTEALRELAGRRPLVVGPGMKTGVKMRYNDPGELGADRVADLAAAKELFEPPYVVVDLGTTTNFEVVDAEGVFIGGIIAPGLKVSARAISDAAAQLAVIDLKAPASVIGKNTREAMQAGILMGEVARIDGLVDAVWRELGYETKVVATGEDAGTLAALSQRVSGVQEHLTLLGLGILYRVNRRS